MVPALLAGSAAHLLNRNSLTSPLWVQCSVPVSRACSFMTLPSWVLCWLRRPLFDLDSVGLYELCPSVDLGLDVAAEFLRLHHHRVGALPFPGFLNVRANQDLV